MKENQKRDTNKSYTSQGEQEISSDIFSNRSSFFQVDNHINLKKDHNQLYPANEDLSDYIRHQ